MHARLAPRRNSFRYRVYYLALPLSQLKSCGIPQERFAPLSFYRKDHGPCDGSELLSWAKQILKTYGIRQADGEIVLICMPRIMGYVFNPVSFWLCYGRHQDLRAVICEVHNTFGERHAYLCARADRQPIAAEDRLTAEKVFHVSPFLEREGKYEFVFDIREKSFGVWIDYFDAAGKKILLTSLTGHFIPLNKQNLRYVFWKYPLVTLKSIFLIHWQALKIFTKGIKYIAKPLQNKDRVSATQNVTKI